MAFIQMALSSSSLELDVHVNVITPERREEPSKVLYLLHGLSGDHTSWTRKTSIERYARKYNLTVVMPAVGRSWYTDMGKAKNYYTYVAEELPKLISNIFNVSTKREDTYVAGLSMGGYGAMKLLLANPDKFCKGASFSGAVDISSRFQLWKTPELEEIFGVDGPQGINDTMKLLESCAEAPEKPPIYLSCGTNDRLHPLNISFRDKAIALGYDVTYSEEPETHNWGYWDRQIKEALVWMLGESKVATD